MAAEDGCGGGGGMVYGGSNMTSAVQNQRILSSSRPTDPFFISGSSPSFLGSSSMVSFEDMCTGKRSERPLFCTFGGDENGDDDFDSYFHQPEKKRRLTSEQVRFLERSFETENKLEPERKLQLAKDLGLQPRQVAIWFQNRRARWKTKQLEKDFDILQTNFNALKAEYDILLQEKDKLKAEILCLSDKLQLKAKEQGDQEASATEFQITASSSQERAADSASDVEAPQQMSACKQEEPSSATSHELDSDSPHYVCGPDSSVFTEPIDSCYALEPFKSDHSQDDDNSSLNPTFLSSSVYVLPKIEISDNDPPASSCHFAPTVEDDESWFWSY